MKKLITTDLGGHPIKFSDFEFIQEQIRELAQAIFATLPNNTIVILQGAQATVSGDGYTIDITEGFGYYNGEYYYIPEHQATGSSPNVAKWRVNERWDARGSKKFRDIVSNIDVYKIRELKVGFYAPAEEGVLFSTTWFNYQASEWATIALSGDWSGNLYYRINRQGKLELKANYLDNSNNTNHNGEILCTLPASFRPSSGRAIVVCNLSGVQKPVMLYIATTGNISYVGTESTVCELVINHELFLD